MSALEPIDDTTLASNQRDMDRMYRFQRHIYDATRRFYLLGRDRLIAELGVPAGGTVLEIGCGTGRNLVKVAKAYPESRVFGIDISDEMLKTAASAIWKSSLTDRVRIAQGDARHFDANAKFGVRHFDRIYFSYTLSMIPDWYEALSHAHGLLSPDGELHAVDFGQFEHLPQSIGTVMFSWLRHFGVVPRAGLADAGERLAEAHNGACFFDRSHHGYDWRLILRNTG